MNFMKHVKQFSGCRTGAERNIYFCSFDLAIGAFFASFSFTKFINFDMRNVLGAWFTKLMNIMKMYEVGKINGFCRDAPFIRDGFMNLARRVIFIQVHKLDKTIYPTLSFPSSAYGFFLWRRKWCY